MYSSLQQAVMRTRKRESAQVPSGSESVASAQGITRVPGRSDNLRQVSKGGKGKRVVKEEACPEGLSEVGSSHSSVEARESAWSEGDDK